VILGFSSRRDREKMGYGPGWILLGACVGEGGAVAAQLVNDLLTRKRERERLKLATFDLFRRQFMEDKRLHGIENKDEKLSAEEMEYYLRFFWMLSVSTGSRTSSILALWMRYLAIPSCLSMTTTRPESQCTKSVGADEGPNVFENFEKLAIELKWKKIEVEPAMKNERPTHGAVRPHN
jgi:hypothetical protein